MNTLEIIKKSLLVGALGLLVLPAHAADNTFGLFTADQGWYLRGDISFNFEQETTTGSITSSGQPLQERGFDYDPFGIESFEYKYGDGFGYGIGVGKQISPFLRLDATIDRSMYSETEETLGRSFSGTRQIPVASTRLVSEDASGDADDGDTTQEPAFEEVEVVRDVYFDRFGSVPGNNCVADFQETCPEFGDQVAAIGGSEDILVQTSLWTLLANAYVDLPVAGRFTPYVGGGVGLSRANLRLRHTVDCLPEADEACGFPTGGFGETIDDYELVDQRKAEWLPTYALHAGVAFQVHENVALDLGYRYTHVLNTDRLGELGDYTIDLPDSDFKFHSVRAGLRITTW